MRKPRLFFFPLFLFLALILPKTGQCEDKVFRVRDGQIISFERMIDDLRQVSVVFVGEVHDVPDHHQAQLDIIRALHESERPLAVGLEMFRADSQSALDSWVRGKASLDSFLPVYYDNWTEPWPLYRDIFVYAREHEISLAGLNIPSVLSKKIARGGFDSLTADEKKQLPPGISCNVDPTYMEFIRKAYSDHSGHQGKKFVNFCEAQMVWDKSMAWHLAGFMKNRPDTTMVVLAGVGHAWKRGIPEQLEPGADLSSRVVLPAIPEEIDRESVTTRDADYILLRG
jgi:uncharacterized iron-regulated protein